MNIGQKLFVSYEQRAIDALNEYVGPRKGGFGSSIVSLVTAPVTAIAAVAKPIVGATAAVIKPVVQVVSDPIAAIKSPATIVNAINPVAWVANAAQGSGMVGSKQADLLRTSTPMSAVAIQDRDLRNKTLGAYAAVATVATGVAAVQGMSFTGATASIATAKGAASTIGTTVGLVKMASNLGKTAVEKQPGPMAEQQPQQQPAPQEDSPSFFYILGAYVRAVMVGPKTA